VVEVLIPNEEIRHDTSRSSFSLFLVLMGPVSVYGQAKRNNFVDQDARGPATTDQQSMLALIQARRRRCWD